MSRSPRERGAVLILIVGILAAMVVVASSFLFHVHTELRGADNAVEAAEAEMAARAGLAHAVAVVAEFYSGDYVDYAVNPDGARATGTPAPAPVSTPGGIAAGWHRYFEEDDSARGLVISDAERWVRHYERDTGPEHELRGRTFMLFDRTGPRTVGRYAVAVVDLDGKLHADPNLWQTEIAADSGSLDGFLAPVTDALSLSPESRVRLRGPSPPATREPCRTPAELAARVLLPPPTVTPTPGCEIFEPRKKYGIEGFFTTYPVVESPAPYDPPPVNVNTARWEVLECLLAEIPSLDTTARTAAVDEILVRRPFRDRAAFEAALAELAPEHEVVGQKRGVAPPATPPLTEEQFNDLLNSLNGVEPSLYVSDGDADAGTTGDSGEYEFDFDPIPLPTPPAPPQLNYGGESSLAPPRDATWGAPVKFSSRYFHIYVVAEALSPRGAEYIVRARKRLHAIYDAGERRFLYFRWNATARGNLGDY